MKTFAAFEVDPKTLFDALKSAGQPVQEIRYRGPERKNVALACVCLGDSASDSAVKAIVGSKSVPKPDFDGCDRHIEALADSIGQKMQSFKG